MFLMACFHLQSKKGHRQMCRLWADEFLVFCSLYLRQYFVGKFCVFGDSFHDIREKKISIPISAIESVTKFISITLQVFFAHMMIYSNVSSFKKRPKAFCSIGVYIAFTNIFSHAVPNYLVRVKLAYMIVRAKIIRVYSRAKFYVVDNLAFYCFLCYVVYYTCLHYTISLEHTHDYRFCFCVAPLSSLCPLGFMLILFFSTNICFICLYCAKKFSVLLLHGMAYSVIHKPCRFLGNPNIFGKLNRRYSFFIRRKKVYSNEPFPKWYFAFPKNSTCFDGKILAALGTPISTIRKSVNIMVTTVGAICSIAKAYLLKMLSACLLILEVSNEISKRFIGCYIHIYIIPDQFGVVKC